MAPHLLQVALGKLCGGSTNYQGWEKIHSCLGLLETTPMHEQNRQIKWHEEQARHLHRLADMPMQGPPSKPMQEHDPPLQDSACTNSHFVHKYPAPRLISPKPEPKLPALALISPKGPPQAPGKAPSPKVSNGQVEPMWKDGVKHHYDAKHGS